MDKVREAAERLLVELSKLRADLSIDSPMRWTSIIEAAMRELLAEDRRAVREKVEPIFLKLAQGLSRGGEAFLATCREADEFVSALDAREREQWKPEPCRGGPGNRANHHAGCECDYPDEREQAEGKGGERD